MTELILSAWVSLAIPGAIPKWDVHLHVKNIIQSKTCGPDKQITSGATLPIFFMQGPYGKIDSSVC